MYKKENLSSLVEQASPKPKVNLTERQMAALKTTSQVILVTAAVAGAVVVGLALPGIFKAVHAISRLGRHSSRERLIRERQRIKNSFYYLKSKGYIGIRSTAKGLEMVITEKGRKLIKKFDYEFIDISKPKTWNGQWWLVAADIPTEYKGRADRFRLKLKQLGFYSLQRTLWMYPFDPRSEIDFVSAYLGVDRFVTTMAVTQLGSHDRGLLARHFKKQALL